MNWKKMVDEPINGNCRQAQNGGTMGKNFLRINLQLFAEPGDQNPGGDDPGTTTPPGDPGKPKDGKYYTQSELDEMISKRAKRAKDTAINDFKGTSEYKEFQKFLQDNKTSQEKHQETIEQLTQTKEQNKELQRQLQDFKNMQTLTEKGVNPKYHKYVNFEVKQLVSDDLDFTGALEKFIKDNPEYSGDKTKGMTTGSSRKDGSGGDELDDLRKAMGVYKEPTK